MLCAKHRGLWASMRACDTAKGGGEHKEEGELEKEGGGREREKECVCMCLRERELQAVELDSRYNAAVCFFFTAREASTS